MSIADTEKNSEIAWPRLGTVAVKYGYVSFTQVKEALIEQLNDNVSNKKHKTIGEIFLEKGWIKKSDLRRMLDILNSDKDQCIKDLIQIYKDTEGETKYNKYKESLKEELREHGHKNIESGIMELPERRVRYWHEVFTQFA